MPLEAEVDHLSAWNATTATWEPLNGQAFDISSGGVGLVLDRPLAEATPVRVAVSIPSIRGVKEGRVAHCATVPGEPPVYRVGVAFPPSPPSTVELLGARVVCGGAILLTLSAYLGQAHAPGDLVGLVLLTGLIVVLWLGAELTYRVSMARYVTQRSRFEAQAPALPSHQDGQVTPASSAGRGS